MAAATPAEEVRALCDWYTSTNVSTSFSAWSDPCNWTSPCAAQLHGVRCIGGSVVSLELECRKLSGTIPPSIALLRNLTHLSLWDNKLSGTIPPSIGSLQKLVIVSLKINRISGPIPPAIGNLRGLVYLYLFRNNLSGTIPPSVGSLRSLNFLLLGQNQISGTIPASIGRLRRVATMHVGTQRRAHPNDPSRDLYQNRLSGTIPPTIGNLTNLGVLDLRENLLSGTIPASIGRLVHLDHLNLSHNQLSGTLPASIGGLRSLRTLNVAYNSRLAGRVPQGQCDNKMLSYASACSGTGLCAAGCSAPALRDCPGCCTAELPATALGWGTCAPDMGDASCSLACAPGHDAVPGVCAGGAWRAAPSCRARPCSPSSGALPEGATGWGSCGAEVGSGTQCELDNSDGLPQQVSD
eukprot:m51a1_g14156 hypothetical protein (409) ;mRNA; f:44882-46759